MTIVVGIYALVVVVLTVHHLIKKTTPCRAVKLIAGFTGIAFCLACVFVPNLRNGYAALALLVATAANVILQPLHFDTEKEDESESPEYGFEVS
jgi:uncharacterized membrane protein HdeD (DUF308 family)